MTAKGRHVYDTPKQKKKKIEQNKSLSCIEKDLIYLLTQLSV